MEWFDVDELLPEDCKLCHFYKDSCMEFTSVVAMDKDGKMEIRNRLKVDKCGNSYLDDYATNGWEWSYGGIKPKYWFPIPQNKLLARREEDGLQRAD